MTGASAAWFLPTTTRTKSVCSDRLRIAAERKVSLDGDRPSEFGGQGSRALSRPIRDDSPAARMRPTKLSARGIFGKSEDSILREPRSKCYPVPARDRHCQTSSCGEGGWWRGGVQRSVPR